MSGTLYGLGVGPGDPDLITLKALKILEKVPVVAYPAPEEGDSLARTIAAPHIPDGRKEIIIRTPMVPGEFPAHDVYDHYSNKIETCLLEGQDVAVLCEGDPFLYGSFMYVFSRISPNHTIEVVPGVSSLGACAAVAGVPLVSRNQVLTIIPGTLDEEEIEKRIKEAPAIAIMKVGKHFKKIFRILDRLELINSARYVEHATMMEQRVMPLCEVDSANTPYFSMVLIRQSEVEAGI